MRIFLGTKKRTTLGPGVQVSWFHEISLDNGGEPLQIFMPVAAQLPMISGSGNYRRLGAQAII